MFQNFKMFTNTKSPMDLFFSQIVKKIQIENDHLFRKCSWIHKKTWIWKTVQKLKKVHEFKNVHELF